MNLILLLLTGADSFIAAAALTFLGFPSKYERRMAAAIGLADAAATLAARTACADWSVAAGAACLALCIVVFTAARHRPALYAFLPVLLTIDNFVLGRSAAPAGIAAIALLGLCSGVLAAAGFQAARIIDRPTRLRFAAGLAMLAMLFIR